MSAASAILLVATVVAVEAGAARIDAGRDRALEAGDRGRVFYQLLVDGVARRIEVGEAQVVAVDSASATATGVGGVDLRRGFRIEFEIPAARLEITGTESTDIAREPQPSRDPAETQPAIRSPTGPPPLELDAGDTEVEWLVVAPGAYQIGLEPASAMFYDQTPRHMVEISGFRIEQRPVSAGRGPFVGLAWAEAEAHCAQRGSRLPTEQEWEIAAQRSGFLVEPGIFEWTASRYRPYPGNNRAEKAYGGEYRVLRGGGQNRAPEPHVRHFMAPGERHTRVGFRCASDRP